MIHRLLRITRAVCATLALSCSSGTDVAGGGTIETTNGFTAVAVYPDGTPAAGVLVQVRTADYVSRPGNPKSAVSLLTLRTAHDGSVRADSLDPGGYVVEITDGVRNAVMFRCVVTPDRPRVNAGPQVLRPFAALTGIAGTAKRYVQVVGLERLAAVGSDGSWALFDLPAGTHTIRLVLDADDPAPDSIDGIEVLAGDTVDVEHSTWARRIWIEINTTESGAAISEGCSWFPLLVRLDSSTTGLPDDFFAYARPGQLLFVGDHGTALAYEIEYWDSIAGAAVLWVLLDTVYADKNQHIRMCWDNPSAVSGRGGIFTDRHGFAGVWHLGTDSAGRYIESGGSRPGTRVTGGQTQGVAGSAALFTGPDQYIDCATGPWSVLERMFTISAWVKFSETAEDRYRRIVSNKTPWYDSSGFELECNPARDGGFFTIVTQDSNLTRAYLGAGRIVPERWFHIAGVVDRSRGAVYVDGIDMTNYTMDSLFTRPSVNPLIIGGRGAEWFAGAIDEVRIESTARSASWIKLCYETQRPGQTTVRFVP